ncbi:hypothetical protein YTPLAS18_07360 [Nitrospira sp.]|nr:hypothetical protein YTPLAS18_07360 [Nitrospira sp.]
MTPAHTRLGGRYKEGLTTSSALVFLLISGCAAAIPFMIGPAIEFARNLLVTSNSNYGKKYSADVNTLVMGLARPYVATPYPLRPPPAMANPSQGVPYGGTAQGFVDPNNPQGYSQAGVYPGGAAQPYGAPPYGAAPGLNSMGYSAGDPQYQYGLQQGVYGAQGGYGYQQGAYGGYQAQGQAAYGGGYPGTGVPYGTMPNMGMQGMQPQQAYPLGSAPAYPQGQGYGSPGDPNVMAGTAPGGYPPTQYQANPYPSGQYQAQSPYQMQPGQMQPGMVGQGMPMDSTQMPPAVAQGGYAPPQYQAPPLGQGGGVAGSGMMPIAATPQMVPGGYNSGAAFGFRGADGTDTGKVAAMAPIELDVALVKQVTTPDGTRVAAVQDGEVLHDGGGNPLAGDRFKVVFRTNCVCYVYVVSVDGSGWVQRVYPAPGSQGGNPVAANQEFAFPVGSQWLSLDQTKGIETYFFVASPGPRPDLEEALNRLEQHERPTGAIVAKVDEPAVIPAGFGAKGQGLQAMVTRDAEAPAYVVPISYQAGGPGEDVRVTRWFRHE